MFQISHYIFYVVVLASSNLIFKKERFESGGNDSETSFRWSDISDLESSDIELVDNNLPLTDVWKSNCPFTAPRSLLQCTLPILGGGGPKEIL
jgi:hypothetical protein